MSQNENRQARVNGQYGVNVPMDIPILGGGGSKQNVAYLQKIVQHHAAFPSVMEQSRPLAPGEKIEGAPPGVSINEVITQVTDPGMSKLEYAAVMLAAGPLQITADEAVEQAFEILKACDRFLQAARTRQKQANTDATTNGGQPPADEAS